MGQVTLNPDERLTRLHAKGAKIEKKIKSMQQGDSTVDIFTTFTPEQEAKKKEKDKELEDLLKAINDKVQSGEISGDEGRQQEWNILKQYGKVGQSSIQQAPTSISKPQIPTTSSENAPIQPTEQTQVNKTEVTPKSTNQFMGFELDDDFYRGYAKYIEDYAKANGFNRNDTDLLVGEANRLRNELRAGNIPEFGDTGLVINKMAYDTPEKAKRKQKISYQNRLTGNVKDASMERWAHTLLYNYADAVKAAKSSSTSTTPSGDAGWLMDSARRAVARKHYGGTDNFEDVSWRKRDLGERDKEIASALAEEIRNRRNYTDKTTAASGYDDIFHGYKGLVTTGDYDKALQLLDAGNVQEAIPYLNRLGMQNDLNILRAGYDPKTDDPNYDPMKDPNSKEYQDAQNASKYTEDWNMDGKMDEQDILDKEKYSWLMDADYVNDKNHGTPGKGISVARKNGILKFYDAKTGDELRSAWILNYGNNRGYFLQGDEQKGYDFYSPGSQPYNEDVRSASIVVQKAFDDWNKKTWYTLSKNDYWDSPLLDNLEENQSFAYKVMNPYLEKPEGKIFALNTGDKDVLGLRTENYVGQYIDGKLYVGTASFDKDHNLIVKWSDRGTVENKDGVVARYTPRTGTTNFGKKYIKGNHEIGETDPVAPNLGEKSYSKWSNIPTKQKELINTKLKYVRTKPTDLNSAKYALSNAIHPISGRTDVSSDELFGQLAYLFSSNKYGTELYKSLTPEQRREIDKFLESGLKEVGKDSNNKEYKINFNKSLFPKYSTGDFLEEGIKSTEVKAKGGKLEEIYKWQAGSKVTVRKISDTADFSSLSNKADARSMNQWTATGRDKDIYGSTSEDKWAYGTLGLDAAAAAASFIPGYGTIAALGLGLASTAVDAWRGSKDGWDGEDWKRLGMNLGFTALGAIPGGKILKLAKTARAGKLATISTRTADVASSLGKKGKAISQGIKTIGENADKIVSGSKYLSKADDVIKAAQKSADIAAKQAETLAKSGKLTQEAIDKVNRTKNILKEAQSLKTGIPGATRMTVDNVLSSKIISSPLFGIAGAPKTLMAGYSLMSVPEIIGKVQEGGLESLSVEDYQKLLAAGMVARSGVQSLKIRKGTTPIDNSTPLRETRISNKLKTGKETVDYTVSGETASKIQGASKVEQKKIFLEDYKKTKIAEINADPRYKGKKNKKLKEEAIKNVNETTFASEPKFFGKGTKESKLDIDAPGFFEKRANSISNWWNKNNSNVTYNNDGFLSDWGSRKVRQIENVRGPLTQYQLPNLNSTNNSKYIKDLWRMNYKSGKNRKDIKSRWNRRANENRKNSVKKSREDLRNSYGEDLLASIRRSVRDKRVDNLWGYGFPYVGYKQGGKIEKPKFQKGGFLQFLDKGGIAKFQSGKKLRLEDSPVIRYDEGEGLNIARGLWNNNYSDEELGQINQMLKNQKDIGYFQKSFGEFNPFKPVVDYVATFYPTTALGNYSDLGAGYNNDGRDGAITASWLTALNRAKHDLGKDDINNTSNYYYDSIDGTIKRKPTTSKQTSEVAQTQEQVQGDVTEETPKGESTGGYQPKVESSIVEKLRKLHLPDPTDWILYNKAIKANRDIRDKVSQMQWSRHETPEFHYKTRWGLQEANPYYQQAASVQQKANRLGSGISDANMRLAVQLEGGEKAGQLTAQGDTIGNQIYNQTAERALAQEKLNNEQRVGTRNRNTDSYNAWFNQQRMFDAQHIQANKHSFDQFAWATQYNVKNYMREKNDLAKAEKEYDLRVNANNKLKQIPGYENFVNKSNDYTKSDTYQVYQQAKLSDPNLQWSAYQQEYQNELSRDWALIEPQYVQIQDQLGYDISRLNKEYWSAPGTLGDLKWKGKRYNGGDGGKVPNAVDANVLPVKGNQLVREQRQINRRLASQESKMAKFNERINKKYTTPTATLDKDLTFTGYKKGGLIEKLAKGSSLSVEDRILIEKQKAHDKWLLNSEKNFQKAMEISNKSYLAQMKSLSKMSEELLKRVIGK